MLSLNKCFVNQILFEHSLVKMSRYKYDEILDVSAGAFFWALSFSLNHGKPSLASHVSRDSDSQ